MWIYVQEKKVIENIIQYVLKILKGCFLGHPVYLKKTKIKQQF